MSIERTDELLEDIPRMEEEIESLHQRVAELEVRLEISADPSWDGIAARDKTIKHLEYELAAIKGKQLTENNQTQFEQEHVPLKPASSEDRAIYDEIANNYFNGKQEPVALEVFKEWMVKELPPLTVIGDPEWWADRIYKYFIHPAPIPENTSDHCLTCANRGRVNGASQETFCEQCIFQRTWRKDHYKPAAPKPEE